MGKILQLEQHYKAPITEVWEAISDREKIGQWFVEMPEFKAEVGCEFHFDGKGTDGNEYRHTCIVKKVIPGQLVAYSWRYDGYAGDSEVTFELSEEAGGTRLHLSHAGLETFPAEVADFGIENFRAGWGMFLGEGLKGFLEGIN